MKKTYFVTCFIDTKELVGTSISTHVELLNPAETLGKIAQQLYNNIPNCKSIINFWEE